MVSPVARHLRRCQAETPLIPLSEFAQPALSDGMGSGAESNENCEYVALVEWIKTVDATDAKWKPKSGIYTTTHVRASLDSQQKTICFLNDAFGLNMHSLLKSRSDFSN